jgi:hypothetical protein
MIADERAPVEEGFGTQKRMFVCGNSERTTSPCGGIVPDALVGYLLPFSTVLEENPDARYYKPRGDSTTPYPTPPHRDGERAQPCPSLVMRMDGAQVHR